jgi:UDP-glucose 4-epimerase
MVLTSTDVLAGAGAAAEERDAVESWSRSDDPLRLAREGIAEEHPDAMLIFPWWPAGGLRHRVERRAVLEDGTGLIESALEAEISRVVVWGSVGVYPAAAGTPSRERDALTETGRWAEASRLESRLDRLATTAGPALYRFRSVPVVGAGASSWIAPVREARVLPRVSRGTPFQFLDVADAVGVLLRALGEGHPGLYNVAGDGLITWSELCRALGRNAVPAPGASASLLLAPGEDGDHGTLPVGEQLTAPRVVDPTRLKTHFGYRPLRTARQALRAARDGVGD